MWHGKKKVSLSEREWAYAMKYVRSSATMCGGNRNFGAPHFPPVEFCAYANARAFEDIYDLRLVRRIDLRTPLDRAACVWARKIANMFVSHASNFTIENLRRDSKRRILLEKYLR